MPSSFFKKFPFYFVILLQEFTCGLSILKQKDLPVKYNNFVQIEAPSLTSCIINTSHPFYLYHFSWVWLLAQINSCLCIVQWNLISIWMFNNIVMILLQLRMINVSLLVSKSIFTKYRTYTKMSELVELGAFKELRKDEEKLKGTSTD